MRDQIDKQGRLVIPKRVRIECNLPIETELEFIPAPEGSGVIVRKKEQHSCASCRSGENLMELSEGYFLCRNCIRKRLLSKNNR